MAAILRGAEMIRVLIAAFLLLGPTAMVAGCTHVSRFWAEVQTPANAECLWFKPVEFSDTTKAWIVRDGEPPRAVLDDLDKVAINNDLHSEFCAQSTE